MSMKVTTLPTKALDGTITLSPANGDTIKYISVAIVQPRVTEDVSEERLTVAELLEVTGNLDDVQAERLAMDTHRRDVESATQCDLRRATLHLQGLPRL